MAIVPAYHSFEEKKQFFADNENFKINTKEQFEALYEAIKKEDNSYWRGVGNASQKLYTSLHRFWIEQELDHTSLRPADYIFSIVEDARKWNNNLLENFFGGLGLRGKMYNAAILSTLRHYGTPVPFIDFTTNPLIGLFFSLNALDNNPNDGELNNYSALYEMKKGHRLRGKIGEHKNYKEALIAECKRQNPHIDNPRIFEQLLNQAWIIELYRYYSQESSDSILIMLDDESDPISYNLNSNLNIVKQQGLFIVPFNINKPLEQSIVDFIKSGPELQQRYSPPEFRVTEERMQELVRENLENHQENFKCYNIHRSLKNYALSKLSIDGISKESIYPNLSDLSTHVVDSFLKKLERQNLPDFLAPITHTIV